MRLLELEIDNVRGIKHLKLKPEGKNFVIWGPNGSGKSAVVDAIDFLLTGRIARLTGIGTGKITLSKHGPHIDHETGEAVVRAVVQLPGVSKPVELRRNMLNPTVLEYDPSVKEQLQPTISIASQGQHVLTRRDILRFITAESGKRAERIQELLNISEIEDIRKVLKSIENELEKKCNSDGEAAKKLSGAVCSTAQIKDHTVAKVLEVINNNRAILGGKPVSKLNWKNINSDIDTTALISSKQVGNTGKRVDFSVAEAAVQNLGKAINKENQQKVAALDKNLREMVEALRSQPELRKAYRRQKLIEIGIGLIEDDGNCPLCDAPWSPSELQEYLKGKLAKAEVATIQIGNVSSISAEINKEAYIMIADLEKTIPLVEAMGLETELRQLRDWKKELNDLSAILGDVVDKYPDPRFKEDQIERMLAPDGLTDTLTSISVSAKKELPKVTPQQKAFELLIRLEEDIKLFEIAKDDFNKSLIFYKRSSNIQANFVKARDSVIQKLYNEIRDRFVELYRQLHGLDEGNFSADIEPDDAGLDFEVDFYGRGNHPPHALHSEGHQDSMGICLYLTLSERLTGDLFDLVILDDVVMSVDAEHRREVCRMLGGNFPNRQFLITTHDRNWSYQMRTEGIVDSKGMVGFYNWHVETGPQVDYELDMWNQIDNDLKKNDVPNASFRLRIGCEHFFNLACDALHAEIRYNLNHRWELGDYLPAAMGQYRSLLKRAKKAAQSWDEGEQFNKLQEIDSIVGQVYTRSNAEQWAVNAEVHYNNWCNLSAKEFKPVVDAFHDLCDLFVCSKCGSMLRLTTAGFNLMSVCCQCKEVDWNLQVKE